MITGDLVRKIGDVGTTAETPQLVHRSVSSTNMASAVGVVVQATNTLVSLYAGVGYWSLIWLVSAASFVVPFVLNRRGHHISAAVALLVIANASISAMVVVLGYDSGSALYLALGCFVPFQTFPMQRPRLQWGFAVTSATLWIAFTAFQGWLPARVYMLPPVFNEAFNATMVALALFAIVGTFIATISAGASALRAAEERADALTELGAYRLGERLGVGGMGEVWTAHHRMLARPAAIKFIRPEQLGQRAELAIARFTREARATAELRSPHTVELFDFGRTESGTFYYVMELLEGIDLEELVRSQGPLPAGRVIHILRQACQSLEEAHQNGLTHRDIKPANLFLCRLAGQDDFLKVLDFGLVTAGLAEHSEGGDAESSEADSGEEESSELTRAGQVMGTPAYMAPEQGLGHPVDARTDIYALGCVAYWLLTRSTVFPGRRVRATVVAQIKDEPVPPSDLHPVPEALESLVLQCLAKDPADRPQSAGQLGDELESIAQAHPWTREDAAACRVAPEPTAPEWAEAPTVVSVRVDLSGGPEEPPPRPLTRF